MTTAPPLDRRPVDAPRREAALELGVLQGLYLVYLLPWFVVAIGGTMSLANWESMASVAIIFAWFGYPFVALGTTIAAWVLFGTRRYATARWVNRVPLAWVVVGVALIAWIVVAG
ncbi:hypothetical protein JKP75_00265 [Blastococcus sp. TML/M2B]|uniref:hypothetical protein n=1 Tax=unclassified Blastococcus TaxID=2619396 RepID=UPI00190B97A3|nr:MULTISPECIES: hypothetical protein [unclassified Blastococcus]MBN1091165.1 hypothetical protein [Blastococcus sp. TML/M2B]MBN1095279.1 hypothetical protein [Blastococcus sp. TML/C7B]